MEQEEEEKSLDSNLWHACAGPMVKIPAVNSTAIYFPQGHIEHAQLTADIDLSNLSVPPEVVCRVESVKFLAEQETDEVYAKIRLNPRPNNNPAVEFDNCGVLGSQNPSTTNSENSGSCFLKAVSKSDATGNSFYVPQQIAEAMFPPVDYNADRSAQMIVAKDIHGQTWRFMHAYRRMPTKQHLRKGWLPFVDKKKIVEGDKIVFLKAEDGGLCVGIRRRKQEAVQFGSKFLREEDVRQALASATSSQVFDVVYYPRRNTSEFCVEEAVVRAALRVSWRSGMRFRKAIEVEKSELICWRMGTVSAVQVADSSWNLLQVKWDHSTWSPSPNQVNPWVVELVSDKSKIQPKKKPRLQPYDVLLDVKVPIQSSSENNHHPVTSTMGIQGARHDEYGASNLVHLKHSKDISEAAKLDENVSCPSSIGNSSQNLEKYSNDQETETLQFPLFWHTDYIEQQMSPNNSNDQETETLQFPLFWHTDYIEQQMSPNNSNDQETETLQFPLFWHTDYIEQQMSPNNSNDQETETLQFPLFWHTDYIEEQMSPNN